MTPVGVCRLSRRSIPFFIEIPKDLLDRISVKPPFWLVKESRMKACLAGGKQLSAERAKAQAFSNFIRIRPTQL